MSFGETLQHALASLDAGHWQEAVGWIEPSRRLEFVDQHADEFQRLGAYESALARACIGHKTLKIPLPPPAEIARMFSVGDRAKHAADLPSGNPITVYRGTSSTSSYGPEGTSWTLHSGVASWFAQNRGGSDPTVWKATIPRAEALAYLADGGELEVICQPRDARKVLPLPPQFPPSETDE